MNLRFRDYAIKLTKFLFVPLWLVVLGLTYVSAHVAERPSIFVLALYVAALVGVIVVGAPLAKLWLLGRGCEKGAETSSAALVFVTIAEAILMIIAMLAATWTIAVGGPVHGLNLKAPEEFLFVCIFIIGSGLLAILPNMSLLLSKGGKIQDSRSALRNLGLAFIMGLIAPFSATFVFTGFFLLAR
jgi:hypothetical protein